MKFSCIPLHTHHLLRTDNAARAYSDTLEASGPTIALQFSAMGNSGKQRPSDGDEVRPFAGSLCWRCANHREIRAARSSFVMCSLLPVKYPRQPMVTCPSFQSVSADAPR